MTAEKPRLLRWPASYLGLVGLAFAFAIPLAAYALTGLNMRYSGDDYCYAGLFRQKGLFRTITDTYSGPSPFHGNRISLTFSSGIADLIGPEASAILPAAILVLWLGGLIFLIREISKSVGMSVKILESVLVGEAIILAALLITPELIQSLYWRSGMFPYLMPLVLYSYIAAIIVKQFGKMRSSIPALIGIFSLSLLAGAYSETAASVQLTVLVFAAGAAAILSRTDGSSRRSIAIALGASFAGTLVAFSILAISPANGFRLATLDQADSLAELIRLTIFHAYLYSRSVLPRQFLPLLAPFVVSFWLTAQIAGRGARQLVANWRMALLAIAYIGITVIATIIAAMLPSAYAQSSYPVGRALILAAFAISFGAAAVGFVLSSYLEAKPRRLGKTALRIAGAGAAIMGFYALAGTISTVDELAKYKRWSRFWDVRHTQILNERRAGEGEVEVVLIDHIIPDLAELAPDPDFFYNNCAEWYYDIQSLAANQPGWDD